MTDNPPTLYKHAELAGKNPRFENADGHTHLEAAELDIGLAAARHTELLNAVSTKFPGETRHQTALRYIKVAESCMPPTGDCYPPLKLKKEVSMSAKGIGLVSEHVKETMASIAEPLTMHQEIALHGIIGGLLISIEQIGLEAVLVSFEKHSQTDEG